MNPQKSKELVKYQNEYDQEKIKNMKNLLKIVYIGNFLNKVNRIGIIMSRKKMTKVRTNVLCKKLIKKLMKANKMRISLRNRNKASP